MSFLVEFFQILEITELEKKVESAEALKKEREEEFKEGTLWIFLWKYLFCVFFSAQKELVFMKNENTWEEEQCQFLEQANNELEDRAKRYHLNFYVFLIWFSNFLVSKKS